VARTPVRLAIATLCATTLLQAGCLHLFRGESPAHPVVGVVQTPQAVPIMRIFPTPPEEPAPALSTKLAASEQTAHLADQTASKMEMPASDSSEPPRELPPAWATPPAPEVSPLSLALQAYLDDRPEEALEILGAYPPRDQELLLRLLPIVAQVDKGGVLTEYSTEADRLNLLEVLRSLMQDVQASAPLVIGKAMFCTDVKSFGRGELRASSQFRAGDRAAVYIELHNLSDERNSDDRYVTRLASGLEIRQGDRIVKTLSVQSLPDWSWSPRHDHFSVIRFQFPRDLEPGVYTLTVKITDESTGRKADHRLPFRIASLPAVSKLAN